MAFRILCLGFSLVVAHLLAFTTQAATFDPTLNFETIHTEHFDIHYPDILKNPAQRLAKISEQVHTSLSTKLDWKPWGKTQVVLIDSTDSANGLTNVIPYNHVVLYLTPPRANSTFFNFDDYLTMLFVHEYTHVLHIDAYGGIAKPFRWIFGKIIVPNAAAPGWIREGWATYQESDETGYGRGNSSFTDMIIRTDLLDDHFLPIDRADGVHPTWPGASTQYLYGTAFWDWLMRTYGKEKVDRFFHIHRNSMYLFAVDRHARKAFGKTFKKLWKEWETQLRGEVAQLEDQIGTPTATTPFLDRPQASYLTWAPDGNRYAVYIEDTHDKPKIKLNIDDKRLKKDLDNIDLSGQMSFSPDGTQLLYSAFEKKSRTSYSRLFTYDIAAHKKKSLSTADKTPLRGFDPDFDADGKSIIYVCHDVDAEGLCRYTFDTKTSVPMIALQPNIQYLNPRVSPDGTTIAVTTYQSGVFQLLLIDSKTAKATTLLTSHDHLLYPEWTPDGHSLVYSSDENGIYNLYQLSIATQKSQQLTTTLTGFFQPAFRSNGHLYAQVYTEKGFEIHDVTLSSLGNLKKRHPRESGDPQALEMVDSRFRGNDEETSFRMYPSETPAVTGPAPREHSDSEIKLPAKPYTPLTSPLFLPRYVLPIWVISDNDILLGAATGSTDPLFRHIWNAGVHYRTGPGFVGANGSYLYNRYKLVPYVSGYRYSVNFGDIFGTGEDFYEARNRGTIGLSYPYRRHLLKGSYFFEDRSAYNQQDQNIAALNLGHYAGFGFDYRYNDSARYPSSISAEDGTVLKLSYDVSDETLGAATDNEQQVFVGDLRHYYELPWANHHVLAARATGGITFGDRFVQRTFALGGSLGESPLSQVSRRTFSLRGVPFADFSGERAMVFSLEYRLPLVTIERGIGNFPLFLNRAHLGFFSDYGDIFNPNTRDADDFFSQFMLGVGAELRGDFVIGHGLPVTGRLGYGIVVVNGDRVDGRKDDTTGANAKYGTVILELGTSF